MVPGASPPERAKNAPKCSKANIDGPLVQVFPSVPLTPKCSRGNVDGRLLRFPKCASGRNDETSMPKPKRNQKSEMRMEIFAGRDGFEVRDLSPPERVKNAPKCDRINIDGVC